MTEKILVLQITMLFLQCLPFKDGFFFFQKKTLKICVTLGF